MNQDGPSLNNVHQITSHILHIVELWCDFKMFVM